MWTGIAGRLVVGRRRFRHQHSSAVEHVVQHIRRVIDDLPPELAEAELVEWPRVFGAVSGREVLGASPILYCSC